MSNKFDYKIVKGRMVIEKEDPNDVLKKYSSVKRSAADGTAFGMAETVRRLGGGSASLREKQPRISNDAQDERINNQFDDILKEQLKETEEKSIEEQNNDKSDNLNDELMEDELQSIVSSENEKGIGDDVKDVVPEGVIGDNIKGDNIEEENIIEEYDSARYDDAEGDSIENNAALSDEVSIETKHKKKFFTKKKLIIITIILAVLVVGIGGTMVYAMSFIQKKAAKMTHIDVVRTDLDINPQVAKDLKNYRNIAILGIDTRNIKHNKGCRSDAIIIASINKKNNEVKLASVFRDSYLNIKIENQFDKVTHAFAYGGAAETLRTLNRNLDLNIQEVVVVNWGSVADAVDALGGLPVNVKANEIDELNRYMRDTLGTVRRKTSYVKRTGPQILDGVQAVTYARIRKGISGGDSARAKRMRILMNAALKKAKKLNIAEANKILDRILPQIRTNMSDSDIMAMVINLTSYKIVDSIGWPYRYGGAKIDGVWYDVPITLKQNVVKLHWDLFNQKGKYRPTKTVIDYDNQIISQTAGSY